MSTLNTLDIARLGASIPGAPRIKDNAARALAKRTKDAHKRDALAAMAERAQRYLSYSQCDTHDDSAACDHCETGRIANLRTVHWPRVRVIRDARSEVLDVIARHFDKHDDSIELFEAELYDMIYREWRLSRLLTRAYAASAAIGQFPVSLNDLRTDKRTIFIGSAAARHFTFAGGRDWGSAEFDPADIVQGAFVRAIDNGDTVDGVPAYGSMFRHIQAERARLTNLANAEFSARKRAALGWTTGAADEWEDTPHTLRLLDTRNYATTADHRLALAIAHRDDERAAMDDYVTRSAREDEISIANREEFHVVLAEFLLAGHKLDDIADALGLKPDTIAAKAVQSREESLRRMSTGIDHSERSTDMHNAAEREREIDAAQERHAAIMRARRIAAETVHYAMDRA